MFETARRTRTVIGESAARFHVEASFQTGKSCSTLAGIGPPLASIAPVHCAHQSIIVGWLMYSAPTLMS